MSERKERLFCNHTSPYARRVRAWLRELALEDRIEESIVDPFAQPEALLAVNPLSKIPVLLRDDGLALAESGLIVDYLSSRGPQRAPAPPARRGDWPAARMMALASGVIDAAVAIVMESRRPESIRHPAQTDRHAEAIRRTLPALAAAAPGADIDAAIATPEAVTLASGLAYLDFRIPWLGWREAEPGLADWLDAFARRPAMQATAPPVG